MAQSCPVNICLSYKNVAYGSLSESLKSLHIEAVKEIMESMKMSDMQLHSLLLEIQKNLKQERRKS